MQGGLYVCHRCTTATFSSLSSKISHLKEVHRELHDRSQARSSPVRLQIMPALQDQDRAPHNQAPDPLHPKAA
jgi:hypothetical protein